MRNVGINVAPFLSFLLNSLGLLRYSYYLSIYIDILCGKGSAKGWDLRNEADAASTFLVDGTSNIIDAGAHKGEWTAALIQCKIPDSNFFLLEPDNTYFDHLKSLTSKRHSFLALNKAIDVEIGEKTFYTNPSAADTSSFYKRKESKFDKSKYKKIIVPTITLSQLMQQCDINTISLLKLDIEGHELPVLKSSTGLLDSGRIYNIQFEFGGANLNSRSFFRDFWDLLHPLGYVFWRIIPGGGVIRIADYYEDLEYFRGPSNYIASLKASKRT
jgi:FkbM family methyltransferase